MMVLPLVSYAGSILSSAFVHPDEFLTENIRMHSDLEPHGCLGDLGWYTIRFILWVMQYATPKSVTGRF